MSHLPAPGRALLWTAALALTSLPLSAPAAAAPTGSDPAPVGAAVPAADTLPGPWDSARVRELVAGAVDAREHAWADSSLRAFRARAQGHVYFLGGLGASPDDPSGSQLVRADQVALRIHWSRGRSLQTIVGRRSEKHLPTGIRYHIDHLSLVVENFGRRISLGEGTEVRDVLHPVAPGAPDHYEYRLADSLGIAVAGEPRTLYRIDVRPGDPSSPGVVGQIHLASDSRAVVRMDFTFTPEAYRDEDVESIRVVLESALWEGRHWLPARQEVTIRRGVRWFDFPLHGVIRTRVEVHEMEINPEEPRPIPPGHRVVSRSREELRDFDDWREGLYDGPLPGETAAADEEEVRRRARALLRGRYLGGDARFSPHVGGISDILRARRAEGGLGGMGGRARISGATTLSAWMGKPFATDDLSWRARLSTEPGPLRVSLEGFGHRYTDVGPFRAASGVVASGGFLLRGEDFTDPYFRDGAAAALDFPLAGGRGRAGVRYESHRSASLVADPPGSDLLRPVRRVREGELAALELGWSGTVARPLGGTLRLDAGAEGAADGVGDFGFTRLRAEATARSAPSATPWRWRLDAGLGVAGGDDLPPQRVLLLGGRGTVPGYPFRGWAGDRAAWTRVEASRRLLGPWIRVRGVAAAGWTELGDPGRGALAGFGPAPVEGAAPGAVSGPIPGESGGVRPSLGVGIGLLDGIVRVDAVRGLDDGRWEWIVSAAPRFRGTL